MKKAVVLIATAVVLCTNARGQRSTIGQSENVVYGMISGMALLMDVHTPVNPNHKGIVFIAGSGFGFGGDYQKIYNQVPLRDDYFLDSDYAGKWVRELVKRGYTVFMVEHRFSPMFRYPDPVEDVRRAVRYIRYNATRFKIDPEKIGAMGHSSGGYLASMLGVMDRAYRSTDESPIDSVSSKVQAVVSLAAPFVLSDFDPSLDADLAYDYILSVMHSYMGELPDVSTGKFSLTGKYADASPITHVSRGDAPMMIYASEDDPLIPLRQASAMYETLNDNQVGAKLIIDTGSGHEPKIDMDAVDRWFKTHLSDNR